MASATDQQIRELAGAIANKAQAIADGTITGPLSSAVSLLQSNVATLRAWVPDIYTPAETPGQARRRRAAANTEKI